MADKTLEQLVSEIQIELYQAEGLNVQLYSQDLIVKRINDAFITFFDDEDVTWKRFIEYNTYTLDGTTGRVTGTPGATYKEYGDVMYVFPENSDRPLVHWNKHRNPALITGSQPVFVAPTSVTNKLVQIYPVTATGDITIVGKVRPSGWPYDDLSADTVAFDYLAVKYYVAWRILTDDGTNPDSAKAAWEQFNNRYKQLKNNNSKEPVAYSGGSSQYPTQWHDTDW